MKTNWFATMAQDTAKAAGSSSAFIAICAITLIWMVTGPLFNWSDTWQLVINTGSSIVTFLMVFLIQNTQNRDTREMHLKLDELILVNSNARNEFMELDRLSDDKLAEMEKALSAARKKRSAAGETNAAD